VKTTIATIASGSLLAFVVMFGVSATFTAAHVVVITALILTFSYLVGRQISRPEDASFLPGMLVAGAMAKLAGATVRYLILVYRYNGVGDSVGYHGEGIRTAEIWRSLVVPTIADGPGSTGTKVIGWFTGLLYAPYEPSIIGGYFLYAGMAFAGQVFLYAAFRRWAPSGTWFRYLLMVMFWPTLIYWPSSIGKEAFLLFWIGLATYCAARVFERYAMGWLVVMAGALGAVAAIRIHLAALVGGSMLLATLVTKTPRETLGRKLTVLAIAAMAMVPVVQQLASEFNITLGEQISAEDFDPVIDSLASTTGQGGSAVTDGVVRGPADIPAATIKVLFRPLPTEASSAEMLAASAEGVLLMLLMVATAHRWIPGVLRARRSPLLAFYGIYTFGFIVAWSTILNLGILARQRSLVIGMVLAIVAYGWTPRPDPGAVEPERTASVTSG
jgi:hypothetical protein